LAKQSQNTATRISQEVRSSIGQLPVPAVYAALSTKPEGLSPAETERRLSLYGRNEIRRIKGKPLWLRFFTNFTHVMALLLWAGGAVAFAARMPELGVAVWLVNLINGAFSFWQEFKAEQATEALRRMLPAFSRVLRDGEEQKVPAEELVPGDILLLGEGDHVPADGRLVQEFDLQADQSTLTGESYPVRKTDEAVLQQDLTRTELPNLVFAGTHVAAGTGKAIVFSTGMDTEFGKIAHFTQSLEEEASPLQKELARATRVVTLIAVAVGMLFFFLAVQLVGIDLAESFIFALGMIVAFVPEGMLPTVTLALAMGTQRMARRHALIKKLSAVETLGCTTVICTDKTGTLTQNEMTVRYLWLPGRKLKVTGVGYGPQGLIVDESIDSRARLDQGLRELLLAGALCNNARLVPPQGQRGGPPPAPGPVRDEAKGGQARWTVIGDPTEAALQVAARKGGLNLETEASAMPCLCELPFEARRKRMSMVRQHGKAPVAYVKGAPKEMLELCERVLDGDQERPLDAATKKAIVAANDELARGGLRVLAMARRSLTDDPAFVACRPSAFTSETVERDLTFLGLAAMMDPPRSEVAEAVEHCHRAGIRVMMITGDYGLTAESIARRIGVVQGPRPGIITGSDLEAMTPEALREALHGEVIFARVAPEHKLRVVSALQEMGEIVAVTGDGVNDAPALKKANIGVAMGIAGTDVAKEAADMILTDDNFASIVSAIEEGRAVYANIKKFLTYIFTSNTPEAVPFILWAMTRGQIPLALTVMQILAIDLGTDLLPALALGAEAPEPGLMERPPRDLKEHVITPRMLARAYFWLGPVQSLATMAAFYYMYWTNGYHGQWLGLPSAGPLYLAATAMAFGAVVTTQIGNLFAQRTELSSSLRVPLFGNRLIWAGVISELLVAGLVIYAPPLQAAFGTAAFPLRNWLFLFAWAPSLLVVDELRKALARARMRANPVLVRPAKAGGGRA
jgi:magnesium-transporting ATPase (P-type)